MKDLTSVTQVYSMSFFFKQLRTQQIFLIIQYEYIFKYISYTYQFGKLNHIIL